MASQLLLFIHGLGGHQVRTWGRFPELIQADSELSKAWRLAFFPYPSNLFRVPVLTSPHRVRLLADGLRTEMERRYAEAERVVLVCHSLGGLIARRYLLDEYEHKGSINSRVTDLLLYGTPNNASNLKKVARYLSWFHPQLRRCRPTSEGRHRTIPEQGRRSDGARSRNV